MPRPISAFETYQDYCSNPGRPVWDLEEEVVNGNFNALVVKSVRDTADRDTGDSAARFYYKMIM